MMKRWVNSEEVCVYVSVSWKGMENQNKHSLKPEELFLMPKSEEVVIIVSNKLAVEIGRKKKQVKIDLPYFDFDLLNNSSCLFIITEANQFPLDQLFLSTSVVVIIQARHCCHYRPIVRWCEACHTCAILPEPRREFVGAALRIVA